MKINFMHLRSVFLICLLIFSAELAFSQGARSWKRGTYFDLALSAGKGSFSSALSAYYLHGVDKGQKIEIGLGVRASTFIGANKYYTTAPAKFTSPVQNLGTIFSKTFEENIDTITTATSATVSLNLAIYIRYRITSKLSAGFNIDAVGCSFGPAKKFNIISSVFDPNQLPVQNASPTKLNLLLTSDNDIGSLNSEFYLGYQLSDKVGIKAGMTFLFSEYRTIEDLSFDNGRIMNDRYRHKSAMALLGIYFKPL
jgi:hypothetical protein